MSVERQEHIAVTEDGTYARRQQVVEVAPDTRTVLVARIRRLLWLIASLISGLLTIRFILKLIAANATNAFVNAIYAITDPLAAPFNGIITTPVFDNGSVLDVAAVFAIGVYLLAVWALVALIRILFASAKSTRRVSTIERQR